MRLVDWHLAQFNIARLRYPKSDSRNQGFVEILAGLNELADKSPGFVWRMIGDPPVDGDSLYLVNLSTWATVDDLWSYTYRSLHREALRDRRQWFEQSRDMTLVLWWVANDERPSFDAALAKLRSLQQLGPTRDHFTFRCRFPPPSIC